MKVSSMWKLMLFLIIMANQVFSDELCSMRLLRCVEEFNNATIYVPEKVSSLSLKFFTCLNDNLIERSALSIMFVIDNSGSMSGLTSTTTATDTSGARFKVTRTLIDTIKNKFPGAEVGMIIFQNLLYIDTRNHPYAVPLPDTYPFPAEVKTQGYVPLMPIDSMLNETSYVFDMLKDLLNTKEVLRPGIPGQMTTDLVYKPLFTEAIGSTNINTAFDAAKYAMMKSGNPKENQFIIFLSDGEPIPQQPSPGTHGNRDPNDFKNAVAVPATFTVYFTTNRMQPIPAVIQAFTENVRVNNYSASNSLSNILVIQASYDTLLNVLMKQVISTILKQPVKLILNNVIYNQYSTVDSSFSVPNLPLQDSVTAFDIMINSTKEVNSAVRKTDTLMHVKFDVVRTDTRSVSEGINLVCADPLSNAVSLKTSDRELIKVNVCGGFIQVAMPYAGVVKVDLFNLDGEKVGSIFNGTMKCGISTIPLCLPQGWANGAYLIVVKAGGIVKILKTLMRR